MATFVKNARKYRKGWRVQAISTGFDQFVTAVDGDPDSTGTLLAELYQVEKAPFFIVEEEGCEPIIYTIYFKLVKEVLEKAA